MSVLRPSLAQTRDPAESDVVLALSHVSVDFPVEDDRVSAVSDVSLSVVFNELDVGRLQIEPAAVRHGVPRVHCEVENDLLDLARIGVDITDLLVE